MLARYLQCGIGHQTAQMNSVATDLTYRPDSSDTTNIATLSNLPVVDEEEEMEMGEEIDEDGEGGGMPDGSATNPEDPSPDGDFEPVDSDEDIREDVDMDYEF
jgi:hypothetical protein